MMPSVLCLNGPNLDTLGRRQPEVYGDTTLAELDAMVVSWGAKLGFEVQCQQSNREAELIEALHAAGGTAGILINPGGLTHSSPALADAIRAIEAPVVEIHLSNVRSRERWRRRSYVSAVAAASIFGRGPEGYRAGLRHLFNRGRGRFETTRYGPHPDQVADLRPTGSEIAVAILHGGFWLDNWGRDTTETWATELAGEGIATANIEYRRLGSGGGALHTTGDAVAGLGHAIDRLSPREMVVMGHSAGAHLALWAVSARLPVPVRRTIAVSGVLDLAAAAAEGVGGDAVGRFDPSSSFGLDDRTLPDEVSLVHGADDEVVPASQTERFADRLRSGGVQPRTEVVEGAGHFDFLDPATPGGDVLRRHLGV